MATLILGAFAVFGYLGIKSIGTLKSDYKQELEKLSGVRKEFEDKIAAINRQLEIAGRQVDSMSKVNTEQDRRLRLLELQEKTSTWYRQGNYARALEYANVGLALDEKDSILLGIKGMSQMRMGSLNEAYSTFEFYNNIVPGDISTVSNLVEVGILVGKFEQAQALLKANEGIFQNTYGPYIAWYMKALVHFLSGEIDELKAHLSIMPAPSTEDKACRIRESWSYGEALSVIERTPTKPGYKEIKAAIDFLQGKIGLTDLNRITSTAA